MSVLSIFIVNAQEYNSNGEFTVSVSKMNSEVFNNDISSEFKFTLTNNLQEPQKFDLGLNHASGWDVLTSEDSFTLNALESKEISINYKSNSDFDYTPNVISPDIIKIVQNDDYSGFFEFPVTINGSSEKVSLKFSVNIKPVVQNLKFTTQIQNVPISPSIPLKFTVNSEDISTLENVEIQVSIAGVDLGTIQDSFNKQVSYKIYQKEIPTSISPGNYEAKVIVRLPGEDSAKEWYKSTNIDVIPYNNIQVEETKGTGVFSDRINLEITNYGNVDDTFNHTIELGLLKSLLFGTNVEDFKRTNEGVDFSIPLKVGETKTITYSFNFLALWIIVLVIVIVAMYLYVRSNSNPLDIQTEIYEVKRVKHEGVNSLKVRIGFENIKESEIDKLKITFKMPSYLQVKEDSFSLTEPKHVLKGESQYKLIWDFKRFERNDTRLLGFALINKKGILGDLRLPDLEIEVKVKNKSKKYYQSFPVIKG